MQQFSRCHCEQSSGKRSWIPGLAQLFRILNAKFKSQTQQHPHNAKIKLHCGRSYFSINTQSQWFNAFRLETFSNSNSFKHIQCSVPVLYFSLLFFWNAVIHEHCLDEKSYWREQFRRPANSCKIEHVQSVIFYSNKWQNQRWYTWEIHEKFKSKTNAALLQK